jgi:iron complex outermembrane receptor protein
MIRIVFLILFSFIAISIFSQYSISGKVTGPDNVPLVGANVILKGTHVGVVTDWNGNFLIANLKQGKFIAEISYLGYETVSSEININKDLQVEFTLKLSTMLAEEVLVIATKPGNNSPVAFSSVSEEELRSGNLGQDLPYLLSLTPSMVVSSDAGAGVGYTSFRIRGTDANRINITVNGIPMNDAESHGVWWVNMPDFSSSIENVQVQRGVGTSTNGAGAFGATINMQTNSLEEEAYGQVSSSLGSFRTFKNTVKVGTGLLGDHFAFDMRLSKINSDGFIDRANSDLKSFYFSGGYYSKNTIIKANVFSGKEKTYQAWNGVPKVRLEDDPGGMQRYEEHYLYSPEETNHMINSDSRTYNYYTYDNETDNYQQDHFQLFFSRKFGKYVNLNTAYHYTYGRGFYEQFKGDDDFTDYNLPNLIIGLDTLTSTDLVRQKWLDNNFYGVTFSLNYSKGPLSAVLGGAWNQYDGRHFGKIIWGQYLGETLKDYEWYRSTGVKTDYNVFMKANYRITEMFNFYGDIQFRSIVHKIDGTDDDLRDITQQHTYNFLNPKLGLIFYPGANQQAYFSLAVANREPNRSNFTDADPEGKMPQPERLYDYEAGYVFKNMFFSIGANLYFMDYKDQLVLTGEINDVGTAIMVNVDKSYRTGIEIFWGVNLTDMISWDANATISRNKIYDFTEFVDDWDIEEQLNFNYKKTSIAFSPEFLATSKITVKPLKNINVNLISQYVSRQYIDNTSSEERMIDPYFINNIRIAYNLNLKTIKNLEFSLLVNNIFSVEYETNAWAYSYFFGGERYVMDGYFPQAGINFLAGASIRF